MKQIIFFILLLTSIVYCQPIDTTGSGGTGGLSQGEVEAIVGDSTYALRLIMPNKNLSNLGTTSINANLLPNNVNLTIGNTTYGWGLVYAQGWAFKNNNFFTTISGNGVLTANRTVYLPSNRDGIIALTSDLSSYAPLASPTFTGTVTLPSSTSIGTISNVELLYLDGVTSGIQSQINSKATAPSGTINELAYFNTSSTISSLGVAAYPNLAELSYVKGATGNIQTQINARATTVAVSDSFNARMGAILDIDDLAVVKDYEPVIADSSGILYIGGVWQIFDLGAALQSVSVVLPDSIVYTSEVAGDSIIGTANTLDSLITAFWNGTIGGSTDTTFIYQRITALEDSITSLRGTLESLIDAMNAHGIDLTDSSPPSTPTSLTATADNDTAKIILTWTDPAASDLDSIRIYRAIVADTTSFTWIKTVAENVEADTNYSLSEGTKYWYGVRAMDDSSNLSDTSNIASATTFTSGGGAYVTDSLVAYWEIADLSNGSVDEWFDGVSNIRFTNNADTTLRPIKTATQIIFDGDDYFRQTTAGGGAALPLINDSLSIEVVMTLEEADTTVTALIFGVRNNYMLSLSLASNRICVYAFNGTTNPEFTNAFSTPFVGTHHIVVTWDGNVSNKAKIYLDGTLTVDVGDVEGQIPGENRFFLGGESASSEVPAGTSLPLARIYTRELTSGEVTTNYNSTSVQDLIP